MKIEIQQLGVIEQAEFELGDMTIICGSNNTGKTYATHATYGFFDYLRSNSEFPVEKNTLEKLFNEGTIRIPLYSYMENLPKYLNDIAKKYSERLFHVFAGNEKKFENARLNITLDNVGKFTPAAVDIRLGSAEKSVLHIKSSDNKEELEVSLIVDKTKDEIPPIHIVRKMVSDSIGTAILDGIIPKTFLASAERTGAAIFQKELDFTRNRLVELLGDKSSKLHPIQFLGKFSGEYPVAVRKNVDFIRDIPNITNKDSFIFKNHPEILQAFQNIIGGEYVVTKNGEILYIPAANKRVKLTLVESSSAVRSLLDIGFYLRYVAQPGEMLMVDEPELNLHPENQRLIARLFSRLVNIGIRVFITTHSDYIIKELNTLIMLNNDKPYLKQIMKQECYDELELISVDKIKVYIAKSDLVVKKGNKKRTTCMTLVPADIDHELGIEAKSFDMTIDDMNRIQEAIVWGEDA
ncbi:MAG: AAA family ATPase [Desulfamplus sp.]|nr:AAA family ATPase [Desulfamplus sp.]